MVIVVFSDYENFASRIDLSGHPDWSKRLGSVYKSDPSKTWVKVENPKSPAAKRTTDRMF